MFKLKLIALGIVALYLVLIAPNGIRAGTDDPIMLTIEFRESDTTEATTKEFSHSDLASFPATSFTTTTNWTGGPQTFTGVPLIILLDAVGVISGELEMIAINEYSITVPVDDPTNDGAIIAYLLNGQPMTPRDKGPLWLVYDYDSDRRYRTETVYSRSIWQLDRIVVSR